MKENFGANVAAAGEAHDAKEALEQLPELAASIAAAQGDVGEVQAEVQAALENVARQLNVSVAELSQRSIGKRMAEEVARQREWAAEREARDQARAVRLRYGDARALADQALSGARAGRDRASALSGALTRWDARTASSTATRDNAKAAIALAKERAQALKQAAKDAKRLAQYGAGAAVATAFGRIGNPTGATSGAPLLLSNPVRVRAPPGAMYAVCTQTVSPTEHSRPPWTAAEGAGNGARPRGGGALEYRLCLRSRLAAPAAGTRGRRWYP